MHFLSSALSSLYLADDIDMQQTFVLFSGCADHVREMDGRERRSKLQTLHWCSKNGNR